jgi:ABC-2 type transport system ATP-binding protein
MLTIRDLVKVYPGPVTALQGINLDVPPGMFGLLGPNGAGKSTLMKILAGLLEATSGQVTLDGEDVLSKPERIRRRLGYLPQEFGFYPHLTGEKMLAYLLKLKGVEAPGGLKKLVDELLERVNLSYAARRKVKTYSGGMRQRLGIAQAIAGDPRLIIVDEPTAGLDPEERLRFYRILAELAADRIVLLSTHIVEDVAVLCPRFAVIHKGRLVALTSPTEARQAIEGKIFEGRIGREELEEIHRRRLRVIQSVLVEGKNRVRVYQPDGSSLLGFESVPATLEDAYLLRVQDAEGERQEAREEPRALAVEGAA